MMNKVNMSFELDGALIGNDEGMNLVGGIFINSSLRLSGSYSSMFSIKKTFCSCGSNKSDNRICSECGRPLMSATLMSSGNVIYCKGKQFMHLKDEHEADIFSLDFTARPKNKRGHGFIDGLHEFDFKFKIKSIAKIMKRDSGDFYFTLEPGIKKLATDWMLVDNDVKQFLGEDVMKLVSIGEEISFDERFVYFINYPFYSSDLIDKPYYSDINAILSTIKNPSKIKAKTVKEFFNETGYPTDYLPMEWSGRHCLKVNGRPLKRFFESPIGRIIQNKVFECEMSANDINRVYDMWVDESVDKDILIEAIKDYSDQYGADNIFATLRSRVNTLRERGINVTVNSVRTREFNAMVNSEKYRSKGKTDEPFRDIILRNPLEALKNIMV